MIKRWFRHLIYQTNIAIVNYVRMASDEEYTSMVHQGHLYLARGSMLFMLGPCEKVIGAMFPPGTPNPHAGE